MSVRKKQNMFVLRKFFFDCPYFLLKNWKKKTDFWLPYKSIKVCYVMIVFESGYSPQVNDIIRVLDKIVAVDGRPVEGLQSDDIYYVVTKVSSEKDTAGPQAAAIWINTQDKSWPKDKAIRSADLHKIDFAPVILLFCLCSLHLVIVTMKLRICVHVWFSNSLEKIREVRTKAYKYFQKSVFLSQAVLSCQIR